MHTGARARTHDGQDLFYVGGRESESLDQRRGVNVFYRLLLAEQMLLKLDAAKIELAGVGRIILRLDFGRRIRVRVRHVIRLPVHEMRNHDYTNSGETK